MEHVKELLSSYLDGMLADPERRHVDAHLAGCADCRSELEELKAVSKIVAGLPQNPLPAGFLKRLEQRRRAEEREEKGASWAARWMNPSFIRPMALAFCAIAVMLVVFERQEWRQAVRIASTSGVAAKADQVGVLYLDEKAKDTGAPQTVSDTLPSRAPTAPVSEFINAQNANAPKPSEPMGGLVGGGYRDISSGSARAYDKETAQEEGKNNKDLPSSAPAPQNELARTKISKKAPTPDSLTANAGMANYEAGSLQKQRDDALAEQLKSTQVRQAPGQKAMALPGSRLILNLMKHSVARTQQQLDALWKAWEIKEPKPSVDFSSDMMIIVCSNNPGTHAEISGISQESDRLVVRYHAVKLGEVQTPTPCSHQTVPSNDLPVVFQLPP